ncbi:DUF302 domain-containing protein [Paraburkholderia phosphatilytica]|uniref:DUF302 domain-containing protein n=1 Tax=Paraburkholderia phosphatilytica TaxID=2282883 RepID=UPI000E4F02EC|nr:DUF302 domain-containing protein [Paraburkholderia phosphatilytica]
MQDHGSGDGIVTVASQHSVDDTADKLVALIEERHLLLFARIDFHADAARAGLAMQPSQLVVFGNPRAGTPLMQAVPTAALDLPLKALIWQDDDERTWVSYNATDWLQRRHRASDELVKPLTAIEALVNQAAN